MMNLNQRRLEEGPAIINFFILITSKAPPVVCYDLKTKFDLCDEVAVGLEILKFF